MSEEMQRIVQLVGEPVPERVKAYLASTVAAVQRTPPTPTGRATTAAGMPLTAQQVAGLACHLGLLPTGLPEDRLHETFFGVTAGWPAEKRDEFARYLQALPNRLAAGHGLVLEGVCGAGKTSLLALIAAAVVLSMGRVFEPPPGEQRMGFRDRPYVLYRVMPDLCTLLARRTPSEEEEQQLADLRRARILLLDEIGTEADDEYAKARVFSLLDARLQSTKVTCFASNLPMTTLQADPRWFRLLQRIRAKCRRLVLPEVNHRVDVAW